MMYRYEVCALEKYALTVLLATFCLPSVITLHRQPTLVTTKLSDGRLLEGGSSMFAIKSSENPGADVTVTLMER